MKNKLEDLHTHLFDTLERLLDEDNPMDLERAETVAKVGQVIVNSAKVEVDFACALERLDTNYGGSGFFKRVHDQQNPEQKKIAS